MGYERRLLVRDPARAIGVDPYLVDVHLGASLFGDPLAEDRRLLAQSMRLEPVALPQCGGDLLVDRAA